MAVLEKEKTTKCGNCGNEMREGYLFGTKDGAFSFANEVPGITSNARHADGFVEITRLKTFKRIALHGFICEECRQIVVDY